MNKKSHEIYSQAQNLKKKSIPDGALLESPYTIQSDFLEYMGSFLKHKKHEWVFIAFLRGGFVKKFWLNKGTDGDSVTPQLNFYEIADICQEEGFDGLLVGHNHPNGPLVPSTQDKIFLEQFLNFFNYYNIYTEHILFVSGVWQRYDLSIFVKIVRFFQANKNNRIKLIGPLFLFVLIIGLCLNKCMSGEIIQEDISINNIKHKYTKSALNVREKPNEKSRVIQILEPNEKVITQGIEVNGFVRIISGNQILGWCSNMFLQDKELNKEEIEIIKSNKLRYRILEKKNLSDKDFSGMHYKIQLNEKTDTNMVSIRKICDSLWENGNENWEEFYVYIYLYNSKIDDPAHYILDYTKNGFQHILYKSNSK